MRLTSITITDLAAFSGTVTFPLSAVTLIQGNHGVGKTSLIEVLAYAFGRRPLADAGSRGIEHDPSIIHGNQERGEALITFDDGSSYRVAVTLADTTRQVKIAGGKRWDRATPQLIDGMVNALSYDPFTLKTLTEKQRVEALLQASPVDVSIREIAEAVGDITVSPRPASIETISAYYQEIYDLRRTENVAADTQKKHAAELEAALPTESGKDSTISISDLRAQKDELNAAEQAHVKTVGDTFRAFEKEHNQAHADRVEEARKVFDAAQAESLVTLNIAVTDARFIANKSVADKRAELAPERDRLTAEIATAEERATASAQAEGTRKAAEKAAAEAVRRQANADSMTAALERLTALKESVAGRLAIKGITIAAPKAGQPVDVCREEKGSLVPFSRWNEADKEAFCLRMAVLLHGKCGVVFVDEIGHFTDERKKALIESCKKHAAGGMQWILGEAVEGELRVVSA